METNGLNSIVQRKAAHSRTTGLIVLPTDPSKFRNGVGSRGVEPRIAANGTALLWTCQKTTLRSHKNVKQGHRRLRRSNQLFGSPPGG